MPTELDDLVINIDAPSGSAADGIDKVAASLKRLSSVDVGNLAENIQTINKALKAMTSGIDLSALDKASAALKNLAKALEAPAKATSADARMLSAQAKMAQVQEKRRANDIALQKKHADLEIRKEQSKVWIAKELGKIEREREKSRVAIETQAQKSEEAIARAKAKTAQAEANAQKAQSQAIAAKAKAEKSVSDAALSEARAKELTVRAELKQLLNSERLARAKGKADPSESENQSNSIGAQLARAKQTLSDLEKQGLGAGDESWDAAYKRVQELTSAVNDYKDALKKAGDEATESVEDGVARAFERVKEAVKDLRNVSSGARPLKSRRESVSGETEREASGLEKRFSALGGSLKGLSDAVAKEAGTRIVALATKLADLRKYAAAAGSALAGLAKGALRQLPGIAANAAKRFAELVSKASGLRALSGVITGASKAISGFMKSVARMALYRAVRAAIKAITSGIKEGLDNLYQYSKGINGTFSTAMDSLATSMQYLRNSIAAAASPLIETLAPAVEYAVDKFVDLLNVANQVISSLMGSESWTKAVRVPKEYADAAKKSTDDAKKSAEEYKNALMGFDEINKLPDPTSNKKSNSGNDKNAVDYSSMFAQESVSTQAADWAKKIQEAWEKADFTEIGNIVGTKLKNALDGIDWKGIQTKGEKIASSLATFINGALGTNGLAESVGKTVGEAIYTGLTTIDTYYSKYKFGTIGTFVANGINSAVSTLSPKTINIGSTVAKVVNSGIADISAFASTVKWSEVGKFITDNINSFFKDTDFKKAGEAANKLISGLAEMLSAAIDNLDIEQIGQDIADFFEGLHPLDLVIEIGKLSFKFLGKTFSSLAELMDKWGSFDTVGDNAVDIAFNAKAKMVDVEDKIPQNKKTVAGMNASLSTSSKASGFNSNVAGMNAAFSSSSKAHTFSNTISGMNAAFSSSSKASAFSNTITGMNAEFKTKTKAPKFSNDLTGMNAVLSKTTKAKTFKSEVTGMTLVVSALKAATSKIAGILGVSVAKKADGGVFKNERWSAVQKYAAGGLPNRGQMFIAREAGPELVGSLPGGGTAVMNNNQIVASVSAGVAQAVSSVLGGGSQDVTVQLLVDGRILTETTVNTLRGQAQQGIFPLAGLA